MKLSVFFEYLVSLSAYHDVRLTINTIVVLEKLSKNRIVCFYIFFNVSKIVKISIPKSRDSLKRIAWKTVFILLSVGQLFPFVICMRLMN